jgi:hypothetical protein
MDPIDGAFALVYISLIRHSLVCEGGGGERLRFYKNYDRNCRISLSIMVASRTSIQNFAWSSFGVKIIDFMTNLL